MSSDDMQNAIEFLLQSQANFEVQLEKTNQQLARTDEQLARTDQQLELTTQKVSVLAETQTEFIQAMLGHVEAQREINTDTRQTMRELAQAQQRSQQDIADLSQAQQRTQQEISELSQVQRRTQQEISDLTKIVGGLVKAVYENGS
jgi:chromosome segregation ATPase